MSASNHNPMLDPAVLLRAAADDQLSPEQADALAAHLAVHPEDAARIECEQQLCRACGRVMGNVQTPAGLRDRIAAAVAADAEAHDDALADRLEQQAELTRDRSFWSGVRGQLIAAAAVLVLAVALVVMIQSMRPAPGVPSFVQIASFVAKEHNRCDLDPTYTHSKIEVSDPGKLPDYLQSILGTSVQDTLFSQDIEIIGAGRCHVPGKGKSVQLRLRPKGAKSEPVSLWLQEDTGQLHIKEGVTYALRADPNAPPCGSILLWKRDGLLYYLVCNGDQTRQQVRQSLHAPDQTQDL
jgi:hypothetical protein